MSNPSGATGKYLSIIEICAELGVHDRTVRNWIREGRLRSVGKRKGTTRPYLLFDRKDVLAIWNARREVGLDYRERERERQHRVMLQSLEEDSDEEAKRFAEWQKDFLKKLERK